MSRAPWRHPRTCAAHQQANRDDASQADVEAIHSYFARHAVDKGPEGWDTDEDPSAGFIAWLLWGGDAGKSWADVRAQTPQ